MAERLRYPAHEARHPWLSGLLDAYALADAHIREEVERESARRGAAPACGPGCRVCCVGQVLPVSSFEALGLWWYAAEGMDASPRRAVLANLRCREAGTADSRVCPFLLEGRCAVYALRPFVCRRHHVFGAPCRPGENLRMQRPGDVLTAGLNGAREVAALLLPLFGVADEDIDWRFESGYVASRSRDLHTLPLENLMAHMDAASKREPHA